MGSGAGTGFLKDWVSVAFRRYADVASQHWGLILAVGMTFAWMHSLPLHGPLLGRLAVGRAVDPQPLVATFLAAQAAGLLGAGALACYRKRALLWYPLCVLPGILTTLVLEQAPTGAWPALFAWSGFFLGAVIIAFAHHVATSVLPSHRGHLAALVVVLINSVAYFVTLAAQIVPVTALLVFIALLLAVVPVTLKRHPVTAAGVIASGRRGRPLVGTRVLSLWPLLLFIFGITFIRGLMFGIVQPALHEDGLLHMYYSLWPYTAIALVAGPIADAYGRRSIAYAGALTFGLGFILFGLLAGLPRHLVVHTLLIGGLGFMNVFIWTAVPDVALGPSAPLYLGLGLGANVSAVSFGIVASGFLRLTAGYETITAEVAGLAIFLTLALMPALRETLRGTPALAPASPPSSLIDWFQDAGLTRREQEVARLLVAGSSTKEIEGRLVIAPDTLKTHLRNIYHKMGVRDRRGLGLMLVGELQRVIESLEAPQRDGQGEHRQDRRGV